MISYFSSFLDNPVNLDPAKINTLIIENPNCLYRTVIDLIAFLGKEESDFRLLNDAALYKETEKVFFAYNIFDIDFNSKKFLSIVYKQITKLLINNELKVNELYAKGFNLLSEVCEQLDYPIVLKDEVDYATLIKLFSPVIEADYDSLVEKLISLTATLVNITDLKVIVTLNLQDFLAEKELISFFEHCRYKEVIWLSIQSDRKYRFSEEKCVLIDNDLCQLLE